MHRAATRYRLRSGLRAVFLLLASSALVGCQEEADGDDYVCADDHLDWGWGGELMLPGTDCIECHRARSSAPDSAYSVAGTVFASATCPTAITDATIHVTDGNGRTVTLRSNQAGNFFSEQRLEPPFLFAVEHDGVLVEMQYPVESGSCNRCHAPGSALGLVPVAR